MNNAWVAIVQSPSLVLWLALPKAAKNVPRWEYFRKFFQGDSGLQGRTDSRIWHCFCRTRMFAAIQRTRKCQWPVIIGGGKVQDVGRPR